MSVRYEPVDRYLPPDPPGQASETTLDSGLGGAFLVSFLGDFLVLLAVLWHTHVLKTRGVWLSRDPDFLSAAAAGGGAASIAATDASASGLTPLNTHAVGGVGNNSSSHPAAADVAAPGASPGTAKKPKKGKSSSKARRPLSWSPSLYRKRLASPPADAMEAATGAATPPALASGTVGSGGGGGPTTTAAGAEEDAASEQERPSSIRSTASAELVRGESIITTTSSTGSAASAAEKPPSCLTRAFAPFFDSARAKPGSDLYVSLFFIQCLLFLFVLFAYQQADHLVQSVRENQLSGGFILVLLLHFILIVADRIIYLHRSIRWKLFLQVRPGLVFVRAFVSWGVVLSKKRTYGRLTENTLTPPRPPNSGCFSWSSSVSSTRTSPSASGSTSTAPSLPGACMRIHIHTQASCFTTVIDVYKTTQFSHSIVCVTG